MDLTWYEAHGSLTGQLRAGGDEDGQEHGPLGIARRFGLGGLVVIAALSLWLLRCTGQEGGSQPQLGDAVISEFMALNDSALADEEGDYSDWIEVHNPSAADIDLTGWCLTDDQADLAKWRFPRVTLQAGGYLVVFASDKDRSSPASELHTNFRLRATGEYLALVGPDEWTVIWEYAPEYPPQLRDGSYGLGDSNDEGYLDEPTPGSANGLIAAGPQFGRALISEFMACSSGLLPDEDGDH